MGPSKELYKLSYFLNLYFFSFSFSLFSLYLSLSIFIYPLSLSIENLPLFTPFVKGFLDLSFGSERLGLFHCYSDLKIL